MKLYREGGSPFVVCLLMDLILLNQKERLENPIPIHLERASADLVNDCYSVDMRGILVIVV